MTTSITTITSVGLGSLKNSIYRVLGPTTTGYGAGLVSGDVVAGSIITTSSYYTLVDDLRRVWIHQTGGLTGFPNTVDLPRVGEKISNTFLNTLTALTATIALNAYTTTASQLTQDSLASSTSTIYNGNALTYQVDYTFRNTADANYFFNLGGRISAGLTVGVGSYGGNTATWATFIDWADSKINSFSYARNQWVAPTSINTSYNSGTNTVSLGIFSISNTAVTTVTSILTVTNTIADLSISTIAASYLTYSTLGPVINGQYRGVASPIPQASVITSFGAGQIPPVVSTKILTVTQPAAFTLPYDSNSNSQPVTVTNIGNTTCTVTSIVFDDAFVPFYFIVDLSSVNLPRLINPGSSFTFDLIYYLADNGFNLNVPYSINFSVYSTAIVSPITVNTQLTVVPPIFDFYLTPNPWNYTYLFRDGRTETQSVTVAGKGDFTTIAYGTDTNFLSSGFSIRDSTTVVGFDISFNPAGLSNGNYTTTVDIGINGVTHPFTATIVLDVLPDVTRHLGHWVSALQRDNGVIGVSYDVINGTKCITFGFGSGADGGSIVAPNQNPPHGVDVDIDNLGTGTNADANYTLGPVLYPGPDNPVYSNFLKPYDANANSDGSGAWVNDTGWYPVDIFVARTYTFNTTRTGTHSYRFAVDNQGYFTIDGDTKGDLQSASVTISPVTGSFELSAGSHTLTIYMCNINNGRYDNVSNPGAIALEINDPVGITVWETNFPIRRGYTAYQYWKEVYRIPLYDSTATDAVFYSKNYIIKNLNPLNGYSYGSAFGYAGFEQEGSMFRVFQDPYDNITITLIPKYRDFTDKTTNYASYLFYYYTDVLGGDRLTQLELNRGDGQTLYFRGFDKNGTVITSLLPQPEAPYIPPADSDDNER